MPRRGVDRKTSTSSAMEPKRRTSGNACPDDNGQTSGSQCILRRSIGGPGVRRRFFDPPVPEDALSEGSIIESQ